MATMHELASVYGSQDLFDMLEIIAVDQFNENALNAQGS